MRRKVEWTPPLADVQTCMAKKSNVVKAKEKYKVRYHSRCLRCGRSRFVFRKFGLCRLCFRELAHAGQLPGVRKASW